MCLICQTYKYRSINLTNVSINFKLKTLWRNLYEKSTKLYNLSLNFSILNKLKKKKKEEKELKETDLFILINKVLFLNKEAFYGLVLIETYCGRVFSIIGDADLIILIEIKEMTVPVKVYIASATT